MAKFVAVDKRKVNKGLQGVEKLLDNEPEVKKQEEEQRKEFEKSIATEKKRRDEEHRTRTSSRTDG